MNLLDSKKGIVGEVIAGVVTLVIFGFILIFCMLYYTQFGDSLVASGYGTPKVIQVYEQYENILQLFDYITVLIAAVLIIGIGIVSNRVSSAPVYFIIVLLSSSIMGFLSYFFNYLFIQMISDTEFSTVIVFFPRTIMICTNLHWIALAMLAIGSIALYGKREKGQYLA